MADKTSFQRIPRLSPYNPSASAAARWRAIVNRDATANTFVYGVLTTKIYCRPSCPARLARRANVKFYDTPTQAETAGFRPCKRCKPETLQAGSPQTQLIQKACDTIQSDIRAGLKPSFRRLANEARLTPSYFHRVFKRETGVTPGQYATQMLKSNDNDNGNIHQLSLELDEYGGQNETESVSLRMAEAGSVQVELCDNPCLSSGGIGGIYRDAGGCLPFNDFDFLIAAENEYVLPRSREGEDEMQSLDNVFSPMVDYLSSASSSNIDFCGLPSGEKASPSITQSELIHQDEAQITVQPWEDLEAQPSSPLLEVVYT